MSFYLQQIRYYVENMLPGVLVAAALYGCLYRWRKHRLEKQGLRSRLEREVLLLLFWMFCGGMAILTLTPWGFHWVTLLKYGVISDQGTFFALGDINLMPFRTLELGYQTLYTVFNLLGNVIMFLPFGLFPAMLWRNFSTKRALVSGLCISGGIECWQLLVGRAFDVDDLLLNTLGVVTGYLLWKLADRVLPDRVTRVWVKSAHSAE